MEKPIVSDELLEELIELRMNDPEKYVKKMEAIENILRDLVKIVEGLRDKL